MANEFLPFATGSGANVQTQAAYDANTDREDGNQPGIASSALNNKALRQGTFVASQVAQMLSDKTGTDTLDDGVENRFLSQLKASLLAYPPQVSSYTSGSGTHYLTYLFFISSGSATSGATYTNNAFTFTVVTTIASGTVLRATGTGTPSTSGTLTKSGGTGDSTIEFYAVRAPIYLTVEMVGGGGGGGGGGGSGTAGNSTTFGTALLTAAGGSAGGLSVTGGAGGSITINSPAVGVGRTGGQGCGNPAQTNNSTNVYPGGGAGGSSAYGGGGGGAAGNSGPQSGQAAPANTGGGGGGGGAQTGAGAVYNGATGGGAGGSLFAYISSPSASYSYAVGASASGGSAGSGGAGGAGGSGFILVTENYQ